VHADGLAQDQHAWQLRIIGADTYYGIVLAGTAGAVAYGTAGIARVLGLAALAAMAPWYAVAGKSAKRGGSGRSRAACYLAGAAALLAVAQWASPWSSFVVFALCPQSFVLLRARWAIIAMAVFNLVPVLRLAGDPSLAFGAVGIAAGVVLFAATFGRWINRIIEQSAERADLIAALAAAQADLARAEHEAGVLAERERLTAEIHDTLAQGFTSILMLLQAADGAGTLDKARVHLAQACRTARENLAEARSLIAAQPPAGLNGASLPEAARRLVRRLAEETGVTACCEVTGAVRCLPPATEAVVFRCVQEALGNVRKHAGAATVSLDLDYQPGKVRLCVRDDGSGFDPARGHGKGLTGMRNRVVQAGGALEVRSSPVAGTAVTVEIPS
jgi:signal transduction histidine kinase